MRKCDLLDEINKGETKPHGSFWYFAGRYVFVFCVLILCVVALVMKIAF